MWILDPADNESCHVALGPAAAVEVLCRGLLGQLGGISYSPSLAWQQHRGEERGYDYLLINPVQVDT